MKVNAIKKRGDNNKRVNISPDWLDFGSLSVAEGSYAKMMACVCVSMLVFHSYVCRLDHDLQTGKLTMDTVAI